MSSLGFPSLKESMHRILSTTSKHEPQVQPTPQQPQESIEHVVRKLVGETLWGMFAATAAPVVPANKADQDFFTKHQLDGAFVSPRLLVVGPPRGRLTTNDPYRNDPGKLRQALKHRVKSQHMLLFDLAPNQSQVDLDEMKHNCVRFDLSRATLEVLYEATEAVTAWLMLHEDNIALLTCTNGIKISSLVAACVYAQMEGLKARDGALRFFERRLQWKGGDSYDELLEKLPPSYGRLWRTFDGEGARYFGSQVLLRKLVVRQLPFTEEQADEQIRVVMRNGAGYHNLIKSFSTQRYGNPTEFEVESSTWTLSGFTEEIRFSKDVTLDFSIGTVALFSFSFPTSTLRNAMKDRNECVLSYGPDIMDEFKKHALPGDFELELSLEFAGVKFDGNGTAGGLELCSTHHCVVANTHLVETLMSDTLASEFDCKFALQRANNEYAVARQEIKPQPKSAIKQQRKPLTPKTVNLSPVKFQGQVPHHTPSSNLGNTPKQKKSSSSKRRESMANLAAAVAATPVVFNGGGNSMVTPTKSGEKKTTQAVASAVEEAELNVFLKQVIGTSLGSPITPKQQASTMGAVGTDTAEDLVVQFTQLLTSDPKFKDKVERLVIMSQNPIPSPVAATAPLEAGTTTNPAVTAVTATPTAVVDPAPTVVAAGLTLGNHEVYGTFFKMLKCGVPRDCVEQKMKRDGHNIKALDLGPNALYDDLVNLGETKIGDDEVYGKYFKMLKCGIPPPAVKQKMIRDGVCPHVLDLGENATVSQMDQIIKNAALSSASKQQQQRKKKAMRKTSIRWDAIPADRLKKGSTIWCDQDDLEEAKLRELLTSSSDFEHLFIQPPPPSATDDQSAAAVSTTVVLPTANTGKAVLDSRRAQSVCIGMAKLKLTGQELGAALLALDETVLGAKEIQVIQGCNLFPTVEELALLRKHQDGVKLAAADEFLWQVGNSVPDAAQRVEALGYRFCFDEVVEGTREELRCILAACESIRASTNLKDLLRIVLLVGNHINGTQDDDEEKIAAITLASLAKLSQTKSVNKTVNVLEYMVGFITKKSPQVLHVVQDLQSLNQAKRLDLQLVVKQAQDVGKMLKQVEGQFPKLGGSGGQFCFRANAVTSDLDLLAHKAKREFSSVLEYLGEDPSMTSGDFFTTLANFLASLTRTKLELDERERRVRRKAEQTPQKPSVVPSKMRTPLLLASNQNTPPPISSVFALKRRQEQEQVRNQVERGGGESHPHLAYFLKNL
ncbi:hypothetical protein BASA81_016248 [Batrachochytrium salamandrivorans]|nr:hypothetical protein BASA81_016248 [Batrachochytrium salamandrivorans]